MPLIRPPNNLQGSTNSISIERRNYKYLSVIDLTVHELHSLFIVEIYN